MLCFDNARATRNLFLATLLVAAGGAGVQAQAPAPQGAPAAVPAAFLGTSSSACNPCTAALCFPNSPGSSRLASRFASSGGS